MSDADGALAFWDAIVPKLRQLIREETRSAVRKKKMNIASIDEDNQTITVYETANPSVTLTLPYTAGHGIEDLAAGQSVMVEWTFDDFSTSVVSMPGKNWAAVQAAWVEQAGGVLFIHRAYTAQKTGTILTIE